MNSVTEEKLQVPFNTNSFEDLFRFHHIQFQNLKNNSCLFHEPKRFHWIIFCLFPNHFHGHGPSPDLHVNKINGTVSKIIDGSRRFRPTLGSLASYLNHQFDSLEKSDQRKFSKIVFTMKTCQSNLVQTVDWWERALPVFRPLPGHVSWVAEEKRSKSSTVVLWLPQKLYLAHQGTDREIKERGSTNEANLL